MMNLNTNKPVPSYAQHRPAPIRIPPPEEAAPAAQSPRAALVAGLRSATDRRRQQQQQQHYHTIQSQLSPPGSPSPIQPPSKANHNRVSSSSSSSSSSLYSQQPHQSPQSQQSSLAADSARIYAALQVKQQELLATSMLISQQQQRIQQAMNTAAAAYASQPGTPTYDSYMDPLAGSMAHLTANDIFLQPPTPTHAGTPTMRNSGVFSYDLDPPGFGGLRPASPSLPVRPSSSASNRGSLLFDGGASAQRFKRGHRKASSLSSTMVNRSGSPSSNVGVIGTGLNGVSRGTARPAHSAEIPVRQPVGPPSTDELLAHPERNFARRYSSTQVVADSKY